MRITYFNYMYDLYGASIGSTIKALELYKALEKEGHQVKIHWRQGDGQKNENPIKKAHQLLKTHFSKLLQEPNQIIRNFFYFYKEKGLLRKDRPDLLISRLESYVFSPALISSLFCIPHVIEADSPASYEVRHFYPGYLRHPNLMEKIELKIIQNADRIFCVSNQIRDYYVTRGVSYHKIQVITNGVDVSRFNPHVPYHTVREMYGLKDKTVIGFVGSFHYWHGVYNLIHLIKEIINLNPNVVFLLVGHGGALKSSLDEFVRENNLKNRVFCTGLIAHENVPSYINAMDIVVAPYPPLDFFYYSPVKIYEYMACGKAIVTTEMGQISELIRNGITGFLCEPGNMKVLIDTVQLLVQNREKRVSIGENAMKHIIHNHTWAHKACQLSALCTEVIQSNKRRLTI